MTQFIQKFIEKNIQLIEDNKWRELFLAWYENSEELWPDEADEFKQFINMLVNAGIYPDSIALESVVTEKIEDCMIAEKHNFLQGVTPHISLFGIVNRLNSRLGYDYLEIRKIADKVATKLGMRYTDYYGGGYTWQ